jgi:hypothetical protein
LHFCPLLLLLLLLVVLLLVTSPLRRNIISIIVDHSRSPIQILWHKRQRVLPGTLTALQRQRCCS